jgi:hypothetical protein
VTKKLFKAFVSLNEQKSVDCVVDLDVGLPKLTKKFDHFVARAKSIETCENE